MANDRFHISQVADDALSKLMILFEIERPAALKIALSKGLLSNTEYELEALEAKRDGREIAVSAVHSGTDFTLFSHLIIEKEGQPIEPNSLDNYFWKYVERGLRVIALELANLDPTENYLLYLLKGKGSQTSPVDETQAIMQMLNI